MSRTTHNFDAGRPQYYPTCEYHIGERPWERERWTGQCDGCKGWVALDAVGRIPDHEPAPPTVFGCGSCGQSYDYMSYTQPPCDRCALKTDVARYLRDGYSVGEIVSIWGDLGAELASEVLATGGSSVNDYGGSEGYA